MTSGVRVGYKLIIVAGVGLGGCMEDPERAPAKRLAAEANANAAKALHHGQELETRVRAIEEHLKDRTAAPQGNAQ